MRALGWLPSMRKHIHAPCPHCGSAQSVIDGAWLRFVREKHGITLREMGRRVGFSAVYLSDIERNRRNRLPAICAAYEALEAK